MFKQLKTGKKKKAEEEETSPYQQQVELFKGIRDALKSTEDDMKKLEKFMDGFVKPVHTFSSSLLSFYNEAPSEYALYGCNFEVAKDNITTIVEKYEEKMESVREALADYLNQMNISNCDDAESDYNSKKKAYVTAQKKDPAKAISAKEKLEKSQAAYEELHDTLLAELSEFTSTIWPSFEVMKAHAQLHKKIANEYTKCLDKAVGDESSSSKRKSSSSKRGSVSSSMDSEKVSKPARPVPTPIREEPPMPARPVPTPTREEPPSMPERPAMPARPVPTPTREEPPSMPVRPAMPARPTPTPQAQPPMPERPSIPARPASSSYKELCVPDAEKERYAGIFKREDPNRTGFISGDAAFNLFIKSQLDQDTLAHIWELSDQDKDGNLDIDEFTLAMYLINASLRQEITIPDVLPSNLCKGTQGPPPVSRNYATPDAQGPPPVSRNYAAPASNTPPPVNRSYGQADAEAYVGKQVGNVAENRQAQQYVGNQIAENTDNKAVAYLARNKFVQKQAGKQVSNHANDPESRKKAKKGFKSGAGAGFKFGKKQL